MTRKGRDREASRIRGGRLIHQAINLGAEDSQMSQQQHDKLMESASNEREKLQDLLKSNSDSLVRDDDHRRVLISRDI